MSNFVYDLTTLPSGKSDLVPPPPGADLSKYLPATHWNEHIQASYDVRAALRTGVFQGLAEQASDPAPSDADAYWWLQNTGVMRLVGPTEFHFGGTITAAEPTLSTHLATRNYVDTHASISPLTAKGDLYTRTATVDARFPVGTAGQLLSVNLSTTTGLEWIAPPTTVKTLQGAYTDGGAGPQVINLSTSGKGIKIRDTLAGLGEALFAVQNSTGVTSHFAVNSDGTVTMAGALTVTGVVSGGAPTADAHLTTKLYVDGLITGLNWKAMVRLASTVAGGNVTLSGDQSVDGFTTTELDRVLLKNQTNPIENGIWIAHTGAAWTRAADMPAGSHASTVTVFVDIGTLNEDVSWFCLTDKPLDIVGAHALSFQVFSNTISQHNALTGLDGGTSGQYYHLTSAEHVGLHGIATGGVTFASATGVLATDASNLFWDNSNKRLGIGTTSPNQELEILGTIRSSAISNTDNIFFQGFNYNSGGTRLETARMSEGSTVGGGGLTLAGVRSAINGGGVALSSYMPSGSSTATAFEFQATGGTLAAMAAFPSGTSILQINKYNGSTWDSIVNIDNTGKVGIGVSPSAQLHVQGSTTGDISQWVMNTNTAGSAWMTFGESSSGGAYGSFGRAGSTSTPGVNVWELPKATLLMAGIQSGSQLLLDAGASDGVIRFFAGGTVLATHERMQITSAGITVTGALGFYSYTAGETLAQYDVVYAYCEGGTSGRLKKATNAAESTSRVVGVVVTGNTAGNAATVVMAGVYKMTFTGTTPAITHFGQPVYLSATAGAVTLTAPGAGTVLLRVGYLVGIGAQAEVSIHIGDEFQQ